MDADSVALLAAVLARPDDDAPRLAFADWLDEHAATIERPCPSCYQHVDDPESPWRGQPGYRPERDPASGRHEGGWSNCKTCNSGGRGQNRPGVVVESDGRRERANFIRVSVAAARDGTENGWTLQPHIHARALLGGWNPTVEGLAPAQYLYRRGFVDSLTCPAASWLAVAPLLHWHPAATDPCPGCKGAKGVVNPVGGYVEFSGAYPKWEDCPRCSGTGRAPRLVPCSAQPVTKVVVSDAPDFLSGGWGSTYLQPDRSFTSDRWPGIRFDCRAVRDAAGELLPR